MFAIMKTKGDTCTILAKYPDIETARAEGMRFYQSSEERMLVSVIEADFDENNRIVGNRYKLYKVWGC